VYEECGNYLRRRVAQFEPVTATAVKLEVLATNALDKNEQLQEGSEDALRTVTRKTSGDSARVYEIRVYHHT
jgi:hypothetical protein